MNKKIEEFISYLDYEGKSKNTIKAYRITAEKFEKYLKKNNISDIDNNVVIGFLVSLRKEGATHKTLNRYLWALKKYIKIAYGKEIDVEPPKIEEKLPEILTIAQVKKVIENTRTLRDKILIALGYECALRVSEVVKLRVEDIDFNSKTITVRGGKGRKDRVVPIVDNYVMKLLKEYMDEYEIYSGYLFPSKSKKRKHIHEQTAENALKYALSKAGITKYYSFHSLRHSRATHLLEQGVDIRYIQEFLGHKFITTTTIYAAVSKKSLKEKIEKVKVF